MSKLDFSKPITTRDGRAVRILCTDLVRKQDRRVETETIVAIVGGEVMEYYADGVWSRNGVHPEHNLINPRPRVKRTVFLNVYPESDVVEYTVCAHLSKEKADKAAMGTTKRLACVEVSIDCDEGEGLE